jgi:hypothetical protein
MQKTIEQIRKREPRYWKSAERRLVLTEEKNDCMPKSQKRTRQFVSIP